MAADNVFRSSITPADVQAVSPALANYTKTAVVDGVWNRPGLSRRDRSIVTVATLIARIQTIGMEHYFAISLDNGVTPAELSEIVTHLAFYCGWSNAFQAVEVLQGIFAAAWHRRGPACGDLAGTAAAQRGGRSKASCAGAGKLRRNVTGGSREHHKVPLPRLVAASRTCAARSQSHHRGCAGCGWSGGTDSVSPESGHGQRPHTR